MFETMRVSEIVKRINMKLAGEMLERQELEMFMDEVVDDINSRLNSCYPAFSEFRNSRYPDHFQGTGDGDYDFFPDRYIRSVVVTGAAYKFYLNDEEGMDTANAYGMEYTNALFLMQRDYMEQVDEAYRTDPLASLDTFTNEWFEPSHVDFWSI